MGLKTNRTSFLCVGWFYGV